MNPSTLPLHGDNDLINKLKNLLQVNIKLIHAIRNPFDVIATMTLKSGASVKNRASWYFMHLDAVSAIDESIGDGDLLHLHHEDLLNSPPLITKNITNFLDISFEEDYLKQFSSKLFSEPKLSRNFIEWKEADYSFILNKISQYKFLDTYLNTKININ